MVKSELILQTTSFLFLLIFVDFSVMAKFAFFLVFFFFNRSELCPKNKSSHT